MQNITNVEWDPTLTNLWLIASNAFTREAKIANLFQGATKFTTGMPATNAGKFIPGAIIQNSFDAALYLNIGSTASPNWTLIEGAGDFALPATATDATTTTGTSFNGIISHLTTGVGWLITAAAATTATIYKAIANALTTGIIFQAIGSAITTGRYFSANNGTTEVWGIAGNGHMHSTASAAVPTVAIGTANGITAAAITSGGSDTCGVITTSGTNNNAGASIINITFGKTYTTPPKAVLLTAVNSAGAKASGTGSTVIGNNAFVSTKSATGFSITVPADATAEATPSWNYMVMA